MLGNASQDAFDDPSILVDQYESILSGLLNIHAPMKTRTIVHRPNSPWFDENLRESKRIKRRYERKWLKTGLEVDRQVYTQYCKDHRKKVEDAKCEYHRAKIAACDDRQLFKIVDKLSKSTTSTVLPDHSCRTDLANNFAHYFKEKVCKLLDKLDNFDPPELSITLSESCESTFTAFREVSPEDVHQILLKSATKSCPLDPIPTDLLKKCLDPLLPHLTNIINSSLLSGLMPPSLKVAQVTPLRLTRFPIMLCSNVSRKRYGIRGTALKWYESYLKNRYQTVVIKGETSDSTCLDEGVPQGSVNGPLLFTLFSAPLGDVIDAHDINFMTYADDTQLYLLLHPSERESVIPRLERCLLDIKTWTAVNRLVLNDSKTEVIHISSKFVKTPSFPKITIGTSELETSRVAKSLGVLFEGSLDMKDHVNSVVRAASFVIYRIGQLRRYLDKESVERLVHAFVSSRLDSCNTLLYGLQEYQLAKLQRVQNSAARLVTKCGKREHMKPVLRDLHWLPVQQCIAYKIALLTFKALHGLAPVYLLDLVKERKPRRSLRSASEVLLCPPKIPKTKFYGERAFAMAAPKVWNGMPSTLRANKNLNTFKKDLKTHLFSSC
ncbi:uncharacterized protein [Amphiura filiformis]|uniref:uncharacterized protein n=1 Tax=Amphiura filiformis TaxID=82378 RepID=UPI003B2135BC